MALSAFYQPDPVMTALDALGNPQPGWMLWTFLAGTTTPVATYTNPTDNIANTNPVIFDSAGRATVCIKPSFAYKFILTDATGAIDINTGLPTLGSTQWSKDNITIGGNLGIVTFVTNIAALEALAPASAGLVFVLGYNTANDGGGGAFYWNGSLNSFDNGMTIQPTGNPGGGWQREISRNSDINILWYGADNTGTTSANSAISAADGYAQTYALSLFAPDGTYKISSNLTIATKIKLSGNAIFAYYAALTISPVINDKAQHFANNGGSIVLPSGSTSRAEWFASSVGTGGDDTNAFNYAMAALSNGGVLEVGKPAGYYILSTPIILLSYVTIKGQGNQSLFQFKNSTTSAYAMFYSASLLSAVTIDGIAIQGNSGASALVAGIWFSGINCTIKNCLINGTAYDGIKIGATGNQSSNFRVASNLIQNCGTNNAGHY